MLFMKKSILILFTISLFFSCKKKQIDTVNLNSNNKNKISYNSFGDSITSDNFINKKLMFDKYKSLKSGDTLNVKFTSTIKDVCSKKGCWMKVELDSLNDVMVRFKNYGFFMPLNSAGSEVVIEGKAFVKETSIEQLKHYAEDAGKSKSVIDAITEPEFTYAFLSNGVLLKK